MQWLLPTKARQELPPHDPEPTLHARFKSSGPGSFGLLGLHNDGNPDQGR